VNTYRRMSLIDRLLVVVAVLLQAVVLVPFTIASGLLAPLWAVIGFYLLWAVGALVLFRLARRRPKVTPLVPIVNALVLAGLISLGEFALGWTA
jgi:hypothetical protein